MCLHLTTAHGKEQTSTSGLIRYSTCIIEQKLQIIIKKFLTFSQT